MVDNLLLIPPENERMTGWTIYNLNEDVLYFLWENGGFSNVMLVFRGVMLAISEEGEGYPWGVRPVNSDD